MVKNIVLGFATLLAATIMAYAQNEIAITDEIVITTTRAASLKAENSGNIAILEDYEPVILYPVELLNRAPGVHIHRGSGQEHLTAIRSPVLVGGAGAGSFLYLEDGISMRAPGFANVNALMDAIPAIDGRVEIVRGPASALYGSNAVHGLVNFISPEIAGDKTHYAASIGSYGRYGLGGQISRVNENVATRISLATANEDDGYQADSGFAQQKMRLETQWNNNNVDYRFSFSGMNLNQETGGYVQSAGDLGNPTDTNVGRLPLACQKTLEAAYANEACATANPNPEAYRDARAWRSYLRMTRRLDNGASLTLTPYWRSNEMQFLMHFLPGQPIEENAHDSIGLQTAYSSTSAMVDTIIGIDMEWTKGELTEKQSELAQPPFQQKNYLLGTHYDFAVEALVVAPYFHTVAHISDKTEFIVGARLELTDYDYTNNTESGIDTEVDENGSTIIYSRIYRPDSQKNDFADLSPKLGLVHALADDKRLFVNLARAARAPQVTDLYRQRDNDKDKNTIPTLPDSFDSEQLDSLELGYRLVRPSLSYEIAAYMMRKENYHFRTGDDRYVTNGETSHRGIELDLDWQMSDKWQLTTNLTYAKHEYDFDSPELARNEGEQISSGDKIDGAPKILGNAALTYQFGETSKATLNWQHVGAYFMDAANENKYDGHDLYDLRLTHETAQGTMLSLTILNLLDTAYAKRADFWFGNSRYFAGEDRRFSLSLSRQF